MAFAIEQCDAKPPTTGALCKTQFVAAVVVGYHHNWLFRRRL
jgi:hypothetical protein